MRIDIAILLLFLSSFSDCKKQTTSPTKPQKRPPKNGIIGSTLYALSIEMNNQQIIDFMIDNAFGTSTYIRQNFGIRNPEIKLAAIQRMLETEALAHFDVALNDLKISYANFKSALIAYHPTYKLLQLLGISLGKAVDNFLGHLDNNSEALFKVLKLINIDAAEFQNTVQNKGEEDFFNLLADGSYEEANLQEILTMAKLEVTFTNIVTILELGKDFTAKFSLNVDGSFTGIMRKMKVEPGDLKTAMQNFDYATSTEPASITPIPAVFEDFEAHESVAIQITEYKAVTHKDAELLRKFRDIAPSATLLGKNLADDRKIEMIPNTLNPTDANYATLWSEDIMGSKVTPLAMTDEIEARKDYSNCAYWQVDDHFAFEVKVTPVLVKYVFEVKKAAADDLLIDGTPLVCDEKLYAVTVNDLAGKREAIFVSKYPIMKKQDEEYTGFFGSIIKMVKSVFKGIGDVFMMPFKFIKDMFASIKGMFTGMARDTKGD